MGREKWHWVFKELVTRSFAYWKLDWKEIKAQASSCQTSQPTWRSLDFNLGSDTIQFLFLKYHSSYRKENWLEQAKLRTKSRWYFAHSHSHSHIEVHLTLLGYPTILQDEKLVGTCLGGDSIFTHGHSWQLGRWLQWVLAHQGCLSLLPRETPGSFPSGHHETVVRLSLLWNIILAEQRYVTFASAAW